VPRIVEENTRSENAQHVTLREIVSVQDDRTAKPIGPTTTATTATTTTTATATTTTTPG